MTDVKLKYGASTTFTITDLNSLASSPTVGWQSASVDNSSDLYLDQLVQVVLDMANTAPANSRAVFVYAYGSVDGTHFTRPATGSQGSITLVDITANPQSLKLIGQIPYTTQDETIKSGPLSVAAAFGGVLPPHWGLVIINHTGAAVAASGNSVTRRPVYAQGV